MTDDGSFLVLVDTVEHRAGESIATGYGTLADTGEPVTFAGEPRMLADIAEAIAENGEPVPASVPAWAILGGEGAT